MISIVIPTMNEEKCIGQMIDSLLTCERVNEIIIVDEYATSDRTPDIVQGYGQQEVIYIQKDINDTGKNISLKYGAATASNEHIIVLDADTRVVDLTEMADALEAGADLVGGLVSVKEDGRRLAHCEAIEYDVAIRRCRPWLWDKIGYLNNVSGAIFGIKRQHILDAHAEGFPDVMGEDMYFTQIGHQRGWNMVLTNSEVKTEAIPSLKALFIQRARWTWGWGQVIRATGRKTPIIEMIPWTYRTIATIIAIVLAQYLTGNFWIGIGAVMIPYMIYEYYRVRDVVDMLWMLAYRQINFLAAFLSPVIGRGWKVMR